MKVVHGDITRLEVEAIVNPANSQLTMGGGVALAIREKGGEEIWEEAQEQSPVDLGEAIITGAGMLPCSYVIHAPTMEQESELVGVEEIRMAMQAILAVCKERGIREVAVPGLGMGTGGVGYDEGAMEMVRVIEDNGWDGSVILVAKDRELYDAFLRNVG